MKETLCSILTLFIFVMLAFLPNQFCGRKNFTRKYRTGNLLSPERPSATTRHRYEVGYTDERLAAILRRSDGKSRVQ